MLSTDTDLSEVYDKQDPPLQTWKVIYNMSYLPAALHFTLDNKTFEELLWYIDKHV